MDDPPHKSKPISFNEAGSFLFNSSDLVATLRGISDKDVQSRLQGDSLPIIKFSPIHKVLPDVLSLIFEECGSSDWKAPITIGLVCRLWREVLLESPRSWAFIPLSKQNSIEGVKSWLERCRGVPLHVRLPPAKPSNEGIKMADMIMLFSENMECLHSSTNHSLIRHLFYRDFPILRKLILIQMRPGEDIDPSNYLQSKSLLDIRRYPSLRALSLIGNIKLLLSGIGQGNDYPPLDHLRLFFFLSEIPLSFDLIKAVSLTLVFLDIFIGTLRTSHGMIKFPPLPSLKHLKLTAFHDTANFEVVAPQVKIYEDLREQCTEAVHFKTDNVIDYTNSSCTDLSLSTFPCLQILRVNAAKDITLSFLNVLLDPEICPKLGRIEFLGMDTIPATTNSIEDIIRKRGILVNACPKTITALRVRPWYPCQAVTCENKL